MHQPDDIVVFLAFAPDQADNGRNCRGGAEDQHVQKTAGEVAENREMTVKISRFGV